MTWKVHPSLGLKLPPEFPTGVHDQVYSRIERAIVEDRRAHVLFVGGFKALAQRYRCMVEAGEAFTESLRIYGDGPRPEERYRQDNTLFVFFSAGHSAVESLFFATWAFCATLRAERFPLSNRELRGVNPRSTLARCEEEWPDDPFMAEMKRLLDSDQFGDWETARNVLIHRVSPPRIISFGGQGEFQVASGGADLVEPIELSDESTERRRRWIAQMLTALLLTLDEFAEGRLA